MSSLEPPNFESSKRERWIQIGKHRHRIQNDLDARLDVIGQAFGHSRKEDSLFFAASFGARIILMLNLVTLINVDHRAPAKGDSTNTIRAA